MYDKLKCIEIDMQEAPAHTYTEKQWDELEAKMTELENLMEKAYCVGALVDWPTLKRIREIKEERQLIRYNTCMAQGGIRERCCNGILLIINKPTGSGKSPGERKNKNKNERNHDSLSVTQRDSTNHKYTHYARNRIIDRDVDGRVVQSKRRKYH